MKYDRQRKKRETNNKRAVKKGKYFCLRIIMNLSIPKPMTIIIGNRRGSALCVEKGWEVRLAGTEVMAKSGNINFPSGVLKF